MELSHVKLTNGDDIICVFEQESNGGYICNGIQFVTDPSYGVFAKSWTMFSESTRVYIKDVHILFVSPANERALSYYEEFVARIADRQTEKEAQVSMDKEIDEFEDIFSSMMESNSAIKH